MASRLDVEQYREFVLHEWRTTFDFGGPHHSRSVRDDALVTHIASRIAEGIHRDAPAYVVAGRALFQIVAWHPFTDCNHRSGWRVCHTLMRLAGWRRVASEAEVIAYDKGVDRHGLTEAHVIAWVQRAFVKDYARPTKIR